MSEPASAVILAGGASRRMGQDKRRLRLWGEQGPTLLERTVGLLAGLSDDVVVVLNDPDNWPGLPARLVSDELPDGGALGGISSGLAATAHPYALVVACDMPFLSAALLAAMLAVPRDYELLIPRSPQAGVARNQFDLEPLHAIYSRRCLAPMRAALADGRRQITAFFPAVHVVELDNHVRDRYDPAGRSFLNLNTFEQMQNARHWLSQPVSEAK